MDPKRVKYLHIFIWLFAIFVNLPYKMFGGKLVPEMLVSYVIAFLYLVVVFYLFYLLIVPKFLKKKKLTGFLMSSLIVILIMPFFGYTLLYLSRAVFNRTFKGFYEGYSLKTHMSAFYPLLTSAVFGSLFSVIINWFKTIEQNSEILRQKLSIELDLLKSKLNPHFLFNTLNNIDSLIRHDPEEASSALVKLSGMMRYLTYETTGDKVSISKETDYIRNFIDLQKIRIREAEKISFSFKGDTNTMIAPALFIPLVENAFKYGCNGNSKPCIEISIISENNRIDFNISNTYTNNLRNSDAAGYGLANLRKRLELIYPGKHLLEISDKDYLYNARLIIEL
ncbi:MAG TPA: sensor histidine kinase [Bacteroidales bacterium]|nr:sensor histidine kinase [Bacteroidales bacterium]